MHTAPKGKGRAIRHNGVHGYIARPSDSTVRPAVASLHLVPVVNESARLRAIEHAGTGKIVLSIPPSTDTQAALTYLKGLPTITEVSSVCYRTKC